MTAPPTLLPAAASAAVSGVLTGPARAATVIAAFDRAVYLDHGDGIVAVVTHDGVALPNALVVPLPSALRPLSSCHPGQCGGVGGGLLRLGPTRVRVSRWWHPRPALRTVTPEWLEARLADLGTHLVGRAEPLPADLADPLEEMVAALVAGSRDRAVVAARRLVGRGPGLTPSGDDVVAGLVAGAQLLASALPAAGVDVATVVEVGARVADRAGDATTALSACMLRHAVRAELAAPAAVLLRALTGTAHPPADPRSRVGTAPGTPGPRSRAADPLAAAADHLLEVGSTSGRDLAAGIVAAAELTLKASHTAGRS